MGWGEEMHWAPAIGEDNTDVRNHTGSHDCMTNR